MGQSSRPNNFDKKSFTVNQARDYFVEYIEEWRNKIGLNTPFYLAAHSFGGFISGHYTIKYPQNVIKLMLISPLGVRVKPEGENDWNRFK